MARLGETPTERRFTGTANELLVAAWFSRHGYDVFLPCGTARYDLVASRGGEITRVQVKTMTWQKRGRVLSCHVNGQHYLKSAPFDVLMCVGPGGELWRVPGSVALHKQSIRFRPGETYAGMRSDDWRVH